MSSRQPPSVPRQAADQRHHVGASAGGFFNGITQRHGEAIRRIATLMRAHGDLLGGADYRPHVPYSLHDGVYASEFGSPEATLWMVVNRNGEPEGDRRGEILRVPCVSGARYFDLYHGIELDVSCPGESTTAVRFAIEALVSRDMQSSWVASFSE